MIILPHAREEIRPAPISDRPPARRWSQLRVEQSRVGRTVISIGVAVTVAAWLIVGMPESHIKMHTAKPAGSYLRLVGLDQNWGVFAPYPQNVSILTSSRIDYSDGTSSEWPIPSGGGLISAYTDYHWQKYGSYMRLLTYTRFHQTLAEYIAHHEQAAGKDPIRVSLIRRMSLSLPPGRGPARKPWTEVTFHVLDLKAGK